MKLFNTLSVVFAAIVLMACSHEPRQEGNNSPSNPVEVGSNHDTLPAELNAEGVQDEETPSNESRQERTDEARIFGDGKMPKQDLLVVISKKDLRLNVYYAPKGKDTTLLAQYPVCLSRKKGNKEQRGDMRTPESPKGKPFRVTQIQSASDWRHDFGDGRGNILAYGDWFIRLDTPGFSGIGIHGSTNNEHTVPGRDSEGCIRMRNNDLNHFKNHFAYIGLPVIIKAEGEGLLSFETHAKRGKTTTISQQPHTAASAAGNVQARAASSNSSLKPQESQEIYGFRD